MSPPVSSAVSVARALQAAQETRCLELGHGVLGRSAEVFRQFFPGKPARVVADPNTFEAAGKKVFGALRGAGCVCREPFIFNDPDLYAEHRYVVALEAALKGDDAIPVAVGSGTINDLSKLASHRTGRPYMCVATAASVDGYTAYAASITYQGSKQNFDCPAPTAVIADLDVLCAAPPEMNSAGYADLLAKVPAGADWILADALGAEPIHPEAWNIVQGGLRAALAHPEGVPKGDPAAIGPLIEGLMLCGFAMQAARVTRPASGAEHQFSHLWDMQHHTHAGKAPSHGFKVGIGTLAISALYEYLLGLPLNAIDIDSCCAQWLDEKTRDARIHELFGETDLAPVALSESRAKWLDRAALKTQLQTLRRLWPDLKERLRRQLLPVAELKKMLDAAGAPIEPEQIGISRLRLRKSFWPAFFMRRRFTVLDLAVRVGVLESGLNHVFGPQGPWPIR